MAKTILVADDSAIIRKMLCRLFKASGQYEVCAEATNGEEAIALALEHRPALIIMDLAMPVLTGLDAAREIKNILPEIPIVLFTQYAKDTIKTSGVDLPVDRIVDKLDIENLMGLVRALAPG